MLRELLEKSNFLVIIYNFVNYPVLEFFDHENIISLIDVQKPPAPTGYEDIYIITDLMETDMHRVIYSRQDLTDDHMQYFMY